MIKNYRTKLNRIYFVLDVLMVAGAYALAWAIILGRDAHAGLPPQTYFMALIFIIPVYVLFSSMFGLYSPKRLKGRKAELFDVIKSATGVLLIFTLILYLGSKNPIMYHFSRMVVGLFYVFSIIAVVGARNLLRMSIRSISRNAYTTKVLLVGYSHAAENYIISLRRNVEWGVSVTGILDDVREEGYTFRGVPVIGPLSRLQELLEAGGIDEIAITLPLDRYQELGRIVYLCERSGVHTKFIPDYLGIIPSQPYTESVDGLAVINIRRVPLAEFQNAFIKRLVDIVGAAFALVLFSPIMLAAAVAVKCTDGGSIIYAQERVGMHNRPFRMYKFRSMRVQKEEDEKKEWTTKHDPRVTKVGRIIRSTSIDEMPQFWNVLKGDMSLVGPRPERPYYVEKFRDEIPHYMIKHQVRPGITGWAQVNGFRGDTSIERRIECDLYYIENWTMLLDIKILFLTIFKGFINKNAY